MCSRCVRPSVGTRVQGRCSRYVRTALGTCLRQLVVFLIQYTYVHHQQLYAVRTSVVAVRAYRM